MDLSVESTYPQLAQAIKDLDEQIKTHEQVVSKAKALRDELTDNIIPKKMVADGLSTVNVTGLGRFSVRGELRVSTKAEAKFELQKWLEENGYAELIQATVNPSTLKSFVKECITEGRDYPEHLLNIYGFERATLTKV